jgi:hypothetical protein
VRVLYPTQLRICFSRQARVVHLGS